MNPRHLSDLSFFLPNLPASIRFKIEAMVIQRFLEFLQFYDQSTPNQQVAYFLELFEVYACIVHYLDDYQKEEVSTLLQIHY